MHISAGEQAAPAMNLRPSNLTAIAILAMQLASICAAVIMIAASTSLLTSSVGVVILAVLIARNLEIAHALIHQTFFDGAPDWLNRGLGVLLVSPFLVPWSQWRWTHGLHHRRPDIEGFDYPDLKGLIGFGGLFQHHLMLPHWRNTIVRMGLAVLSRAALSESLVRSVKGFASPSHRVLARVAREFILIMVAYLAFQTLIFGVFSWRGVAIVLLVQALAGIAHTIIELPEHLLGDAHSADPRKNSYEIVGSPLLDSITFFNTRHVSHHLFPNVPIYRLREVSERNSNVPPENCSTYGAFWRRYFKDYLFSGGRFRI